MCSRCFFRRREIRGGGARPPGRACQRVCCTVQCTCAVASARARSERGQDGIAKLQQEHCTSLAVLGSREGASEAPARDREESQVNAQSETSWSFCRPQALVTRARPFILCGDED
jgi:hypothetical protein